MARKPGCGDHDLSRIAGEFIDSLATDIADSP